MGKQAKLKQARREGKEVKKEPVYNLTQAQLDSYVKREVLKFKREIATELTTNILSTMLIQCFDVLNTHFKFGNLRLQRFRYHMDNTSDLIKFISEEEPDSNYYSEIVQNLEDKGIDVDKLLKGNIDEHSLRRRCDMEKVMPKVKDLPNERGSNNGKEKAKICS